jgi:hypothetical protein
MTYQIEIDDTLIPLREFCTENLCESRNPDGSIYQTRYKDGFVSLLQEMANEKADAFLAQVIAQGPAELLPENIKVKATAALAAEQAHQNAVAAIVTARKEVSGAKEKPLAVLNEPPAPIVVEPPIEEVLPGEKLSVEGLKP